MIFIKLHCTLVCVAFLVALMAIVPSSLQNSLRRKSQTPYLPETKFSYNEYAEYPDNQEVDKGPQAPQWSQLPNRDVSLSQSALRTTPAPASNQQELDANIVWDDKWPSDIKFGQLSAVAIDPEGNVALFHRGERVWGLGTFDNNEKFDRDNGPIRQNTVVLLNKAGEKTVEWGRNMFYLPHGLTIDHAGNYWVTDVALHQVLKFDAKDIHNAKLDGPKSSRDSYSKYDLADSHVPEDLRNDAPIKPSLVLGEAFEPGNTNERFCKPTSVAVHKNGDFFVSDGYCNSRIIKFNDKGERILTWGRKWGFEESQFHKAPSNAFFVPHSLALAEDLDYVFVADRENGRISCFHSSNGTFHREYRHPSIGTRIFSIAYAKEKIYLVNGPEFGRFGTHVRGFVIDINSGSIQSQFAPLNDMNNPHDIAVSEDGRLIYVVELDPHKVHKFSQDTNSTLQNHKADVSAHSGIHPSAVTLHHKTSPLTDVNSSIDSTGQGVTATTIILSLITAAVVLATLCIAIAAIVARCRKRGRFNKYGEPEVEFNKLIPES